jgi:hypothetical protein
MRPEYTSLFKRAYKACEQSYAPTLISVLEPHSSVKMAA